VPIPKRRGVLVVYHVRSPNGTARIPSAPWFPRVLGPPRCGCGDTDWSRTQGIVRARSRSRGLALGFDRAVASRLPSPNSHRPEGTTLTQPRVEPWRALRAWAQPWVGGAPPLHVVQIARSPNGTALMRDGTFVLGPPRCGCGGMDWNRFAYPGRRQRSLSLTMSRPGLC
jgi:hypothetical protein